jgi:hypothetical protein
MEFRCPHCGGMELRKVSVVYQEDRYQLRARTRHGGLLLGTDGPDFVLGNSHTAGVLQTELSKKLQPPGRSSYLKLVGWFALGSLVALVAYLQWVMSRSTRASSLPVAAFVLVVPPLFFLLAYFVWRHNRREYPRKYAEWERSFMCRRCGEVREHANPVGVRSRIA